MKMANSMCLMCNNVYLHAIVIGFNIGLSKNEY